MNVGSAPIYHEVPTEGIARVSYSLERLPPNN